MRELGPLRARRGDLFERLFDLAAHAREPLQHRGGVDEVRGQQATIDSFCVRGSGEGVRTHSSRAARALSVSV